MSYSPAIGKPNRIEFGYSHNSMKCALGPTCVPRLRSRSEMVFHAFFIQ
jgi:hypothetical protein